MSETTKIADPRRRWWVEDIGAAGRGAAWRIRGERGTVADMRVYPGNGDDALLIAAAPDLLEALKRVILDKNEDGELALSNLALAIAQDAIDRAEA